MNTMTAADRERDWNAHRELRRLGILEDLDPNKLYARGLTVLALCADEKDVSPFLRTQQEKLGLPHAVEDMVSVTRIGGPLRLAVKSPCNKAGRSTAADFQDDLEEAMELTERTRISPATHWPCRKAYRHKISMGTSLAWYFRGVEEFRFRHRESDRTCVPLHHVHSSSPETRNMLLYRVNFLPFLDFLLSCIQGAGNDELASLLFTDTRELARALPLICSKKR